MGLEKFKDEVLLRRLENYDQKYYNAITKPSAINYGYAMRAYHAMKVCNPPEWKIREKAQLVADELTSRGISFHTRWLRFTNQ